MAREHRFWSEPQHERWIQEKAAARKSFTIFVGAGASMEIGFPSWDELLTRLLVKVAPEFDLDAANATACEKFAEGVLRSEGSLGAAEIVRAVFPKLADFEAAVIEALYREKPDPQPGPTALAVARLYRALDGQCEIATFNYDFLLELALMGDLGGGFSRQSVRPVADGIPYPGKHVVRHLHGARNNPDCTTGFANKGTLVLSERDYMSNDDSWQQDWVVSRLQTSECIFVGIGMSDLNLLRFLHRAKKFKPASTAIVAKTPLADLAPLPEGVPKAQRKASDARWREAGVEVIWPDHYIQSPQMLHELAFRIQAGKDYRTYSQRMAEWEASMNKGLAYTRSPKLFAEKQDEIQALLQEEIAYLRDVIQDDLGKKLPRRERLALHLWIRRWKQGGLALWGASDRTWRDARTLNAVPILSDTKWVSVLAFRAGVPTSSELEASRWGSVTGYPIFLDDDYWGRLPVGVITFASSLPKPLAATDALSAAAADEIFAEIQSVGRAFLDPRLPVT